MELWKNCCKKNLKTIEIHTETHKIPYINPNNHSINIRQNNENGRFVWSQDQGGPFFLNKYLIMIYLFYGGIHTDNSEIVLKHIKQNIPWSTPIFFSCIL
jgi:hypothetical protein